MFFSKKKQQQLEKQISDADNLLRLQKERITELENENAKLKSQIEKYKAERDDVTYALIKAQKKSREMISETNEEYFLELKRLKMFSAKWENFFKGQILTKMGEEYTNKIDDVVKGINEIIDCDVIGCRGISNKEKVEKIRDLIDKSRAKQGVYGEYSVSESGLDLNEVINPTGDLDLFELCKELGVTEDN